MTLLRGFQQDVKLRSYKAWDEGARVVMPVIPTGGGKTTLMGSVAHDYDGFGCAIAHRGELVGQIAIALAREGVRHDIIAPKPLIRTIVLAQIEDMGRTFYDPRANWKVASVDTIIRRELNQNWVNRVGMVFQDEGHHVLKTNKWGHAFNLFPHARGYFPTATPERADGRGLGSHADGLVDTMVEGPNLAWMIANGYLTNYDLAAPKVSDLNLEGVDVSAITGDYVEGQMIKRVKQSTKIIGDVVKTYLRRTPNKLAICFAVDVEHATMIATAFNAAAVPARVVHSGTPEAERRLYMKQFRNRELKVLVNVDLFGEGVDVPALEAVIFARPTASYGLFVQQFGRTLRLMIEKFYSDKWDSFSVAERLKIISESVKPIAFITDHVGNIVKHFGPPDYRKEPWTLDARSKRNAPTDQIPLRVCDGCEYPYERIQDCCPKCGKVPEPPIDRSRPEFVDGDVILYDAELLEKLFGERAKVDDKCYVPQNVTPEVAGAIRKRHRERQEAQMALRQTMGLVLPPTKGDSFNNKKFFFEFGVDTISAQVLGSTEAEKLRQRILEKVATK